MMIDRASSSDPNVRALLAGHPRVGEVTTGSDALAWSQGSWNRRILVGQFQNPLYGLPELMDNNPLVCADEISVPSPAVTLALIAFGPLAEAGLIADAPTFVTNLPIHDRELDAAINALGWSGGVLSQTESLDLGSVVTATAMVAITTPDDLDDVDALYEERFGRSFFVRRDEKSEWERGLVAGRPEACFRLRIAADTPTSLLTIRVLADLNGKTGATQLIHAMNVMCGFEESLGGA